MKSIPSALSTSARTFAIAAALAAVHAAVGAAPSDAQLERGRYISMIAGCNDCHTEGYAPSGGKVPQEKWFTGSVVGSRGPWGTTYAVNLRIYMKALSEDEWVARAQTVRTRPPMPWFALHAMKEGDLRDLHAFIRSIEPVGEPAPAYLPPGVDAKGPVIVFPGPPGK